MAIIPQQKLFDYTEIEELGDLERFFLAKEYIPDEEFMKKLEKERGNGRDDYPVRAMWNSILAGIIYEHSSIESLRRELKRNGQLRYLCGFEGKIPTSSAYSRFINKLIEHEENISNIFDTLVSELTKLLPDFGKHLACDSKAIDSLANPHKYDNLEEDGRRDIDADWSKKVYRGQRKDGSNWEKIVKWFGYKLHLVVDAEYELPVAFDLDKASSSDVIKGHELVEKIKNQHPTIMDSCEFFMGDRAYDDAKLITTLWDDNQIKPVIDIRNMWKDGEETRLIEGQENVVYNYCGMVFCYDPATNKKREMAYGGFEKDRKALKYRCPADHYGIECKGCTECPVNGAVRIKLTEERRVFTPLARSSYSWKREYKKRTAVERVNSRLDVSFGFEKHYIRGQKKMKMRLSLAFIVMLGMALGRIKQNQGDKMRSLVQAA